MILLLTFPIDPNPIVSLDNLHHCPQMLVSPAYLQLMPPILSSETSIQQTTRDPAQIPAAHYWSQTCILNVRLAFSKVFGLVLKSRLIIVKEHGIRAALDLFYHFSIFSKSICLNRSQETNRPQHLPYTDSCSFLDYTSSHSISYKDGILLSQFPRLYHI